MAPGTTIGNIEVVAPRLRLEVGAAVSLDPVVVLALPSHKVPVAEAILACSGAIFCSQA